LAFKADYFMIARSSAFNQDV